MSLTRAEFQASLESSFYGLAFPSTTTNFQRCIISNSNSECDVFATSYLRALGKINGYLAQWDAAPDQPSKDVVVGSVVLDLGSASVNPEDAYTWPPSGHFGKFGTPSTVAQSTYSSNVNGVQTGNTLITTIGSGKRLIPQVVNFTLTTVQGLSIVATCSVGTNSPNYNNILGNTLLNGLTTQNNQTVVNLTGVSATAGPSSQIYCRVSVASTATTYSLLASLTGFLIDSA